MHHRPHTDFRPTLTGKGISRAGRPPGPPPPPPPAENKPGRPPQPRTEWFLRVFDQYYINSTPPVPDRILNNQTRFFISGLGLNKGSSILDLACGTGNHTRRLAQRGFQITGLDSSGPMLGEAQRELDRWGLGPHTPSGPVLVRQDMRSLDYRGEFDGVLLAGTSFGYFTHRENEDLLNRINRSLKIGGRLLIETINRDYHQFEMPSNSIWSQNQILISEQVVFDQHTSTLNSERNLVFDNGGTRTDTISIRLYSLHEFEQMFTKAGFTMEAVSGGILCGPRLPGPNTPRLIMVAGKTKEAV